MVISRKVNPAIPCSHIPAVFHVFFMSWMPKKSPPLLSLVWLPGRRQDGGKRRRGGRSQTRSNFLLTNPITHFFSKCSEKSSLTLYHDSRRCQLLRCTGTRTGCTLPVWRVTQLLTVSFFLSFELNGFKFCFLFASKCRRRTVNFERHRCSPLAAVTHHVAVRLAFEVASQLIRPHFPLTGCHGDSHLGPNDDLQWVSGSVLIVSAAPTRPPQPASSWALWEVTAVGKHEGQRSSAPQRSSEVITLLSHQRRRSAGGSTDIAHLSPPPHPASLCRIMKTPSAHLAFEKAPFWRALLLNSSWLAEVVKLMAAEGCKIVFLVRKWACKCRLMPLQLFTEQLLMNLLKEVVTEPGTPVRYRHNSFLLMRQCKTIRLLEASSVCSYCLIVCFPNRTRTFLGQEFMFQVPKVSLKSI